MSQRTWPCNMTGQTGWRAGRQAGRRGDTQSGRQAYATRNMLVTEESVALIFA